jgi:hypothetical protein
MTTNDYIIPIKEEATDIENFGKIAREAILDLENLLRSQEGSIIGDSPLCPLTHTFSDGIYVRQIEIPAGMLIVGKIHKHEHPNFLLKGEVVVVTEFGQEHLEAPCSMISSGGTKRALYAITDLVWTTVHLNPTNTRDLKELEDDIIAPSYEEYDKHIKLEGGLFKKLKKSLIKILSK